MSFAPKPLVYRLTDCCRPLFLTLALFACALAGVPPLLSAQTPGTLDPSFTSAFTDSAGFALLLNTPPNGDVTQEEIFAGGDFAGFNKLLPDGSVDKGFLEPTFGSAARIVYTAVQELPLRADQPILFAGQFGRTAVQINDKLPGQNIIRLQANGIQDGNFAPGAGSNGFITSVLPQVTADGTQTEFLVVAGEFLQFNQVNHERIVRLTEATGVVDPAFNPGLGIDSTVLSLATQLNPDPNGPQGQILVAGTFGLVDGAAHTKLARLSRDGHVDNSFNPTFDGRVVVVASQPDGKILVGGDFLLVNGKAASHVARLNYDGTLDAGFTASVNTEPSGLNFPPSVYVIKVLPDGRIFLGGNFAKINGQTRNFLGLVNADGTLDGFDPGNNLPNPVQSLAIQADNKLLLGMNRTISVNGARPKTLVRLFGVAPLPLPSVSVAASASISTRANPAQLVFTRSADRLALPLNINVRASRINTVGYKLKAAKSTVFTSGSTQLFNVTFPAGVDTVRLRVVPTSFLVTPSRPLSGTARFALKPASGTSQSYTVSNAAKVTLTLAANP